MKDNKLIAEFMGLSIKEGVCYYTDSNDMFPMGIEVEEPYLPYNKSWDWLMPVAESIFKRLDSRDNSTTEIKKYMLLCCLDETYNAIVEFIKHYNLNHTK